MIAVAVKELKNRLSAYLREVKRGEIVLVTDRGNVVAELRQPGDDTRLPPACGGLRRLEEQGALTMGLPNDPSVYKPSPIKFAIDSQTLLDADREDK